jgi:hypothetical protein
MDKNTNFIYFKQTSRGALGEQVFVQLGSSSNAKRQMAVFIFAVRVETNARFR